MRWTRLLGLALILLFFMGTAGAGPGLVVPASSHLPGQHGSVVIRNATPHTLLYVYISPVSDRNWGEDKLGSDVILAGASRRVRLPDTQAAYFDVRAEDAEGNTYTFMRFEARQLTLTISLGDRDPGRALEDSTGTSFAIAKGVLLTNHHVVAGCRNVSIITPRGKVDGVVVASNPRVDLALIEAPGLDSRVASIRASRSLELGEEVFAYGFPLTGLLASEGNFTPGMVSALRGLGDSDRRIQITAPVQPGNSGGPLIDVAGNVVGVIVGKLNSLAVAKTTGDLAQNVNFAVSLGAIEEFLEQSRIRTIPVTQFRKIPSTEVARIARSFTFRVECLAAEKRAETVRAADERQRRAQEDAPQRREAERQSEAAAALARRAQERREAERRAEETREPVIREQQRQRIQTSRERPRLEDERRAFDQKPRDSQALIEYGSRVRAAVRANTIYAANPSEASNISPAVFKVFLDFDCSLRSVVLVASSGVSLWDRAAYNAIGRTNPFPPLEEGRCPTEIIISSSVADSK
jgi:S1-C subfamily serine protease